MKKIFANISIVSLILLAAGCAKEIAGQEDMMDQVKDAVEATGEEITVTFSVPDSDETKTALGTKNGSSYPVKWSTNDPGRITLNGSAPSSSNKDSDTQITATFKPAAGLSVYNFLYRGDAGKDNQVTIPASQTYYANDFDDAAMPMYAASATRSNSVTFSHLCSLLKFSLICTDTDHLPSNKGIDSVTLTAEDENMSLSGTFTIGKTGAGLLNGTLTPASGGASLTYSFGSHKSLSSTPFVFYVAIPAGTYEGGIKLTIVDNNGGSMDMYVMTEASKKTIEAGKVREFETVDYVPAAEANLIMIYDDTSFLKFVNAVAGGRKTVNARVTKNTSPLVLSSATVSQFNSIEGYKGIFDGNNKAIKGLDKPLFDDLQGVVKNLTLDSTIEETDPAEDKIGMFARELIPSDEVDDDPGLYGCTAQGKVQYTPSGAITASTYPCLGGLVGVNRGGTISGCTNEARVIFEDGGTPHGEIQPSIGGVVGRNHKASVLTNCSNTSNEVSCAADFAAGVYIGGVIGYAVEKADNIAGCTNVGLVKVTSAFSTTGPLHIGGVIGMSKGTIETCSNLSGGTVTTEACSVGTYLCQGGVVGRMNNTSGTYSGLSNAGNINVAAAGASTGAYIGGIVGRCNEGASLSDCSTIGGTIEFTGSISTCELSIGGIVGNTNKPVSNCTNGTAIVAGGIYSFNSSGKYYSVGGIVGYQKSDEALTNNTNTAAITFSGASSGYTAVAGICGYCNGTISGGGNSGTITFSGSSNTQNIPIGGVAARTPSGKSGDRISGVTNSGAIVINTSSQNKKVVYVGGVVGHHQSGDFTATNSGRITVTNLKCTQLLIGGLVGQTAGAILSGSANQTTGDISIAGLTSGEQSWIGGLVGKSTSGAITGNNAGDVIVTSGSTVAGDLLIGGIVGEPNGAVSSCTNSGLVSNSAPMTNSSSWLQVGGIAGWNNNSSPISNCHNTGNVTNSGNSANYIVVGGISSENKALISNCDNIGDVSNSGNSGNGKFIAVGGVVGCAHNVDARLTSCSNGTSSAAGGTISNSGTSAEDVCLGGVAGINGYEAESTSVGFTFTSCYNKGAVTNTGNSNSGYNVNIGGLVGWSSAGSSYASTCYNTGAISNTGIGSNSSAPGVRMGGLFGCAKGLHSMSGSSCYNNGTVTENSSSSIAYIGGICGFYLDADGQVEATSFAGIQNRSSGTITMSGTHHTAVAGGVLGSTDYSVSLSTCSNAGAINYTNCITDNVRVGGILGVTGGSGVPNISGTDSSHWTINTGNIKFTTCTVADQVTAGGIFGSWENDVAATIQYCKNSGTITTNTQGTNSEDICTENMPYFSYVAGIGTCTDGGKGKTFTHCQNTGDIKLYFQSKHRVGGITAMCVIPPSYCDVQADLIVGMPGTPDDVNGGIGGIAAVLYDSSHSSLTFNNLYFNGNVRAEYNHGDKRSYITGLLAARPSNTGTTLTFNNCKVGGEIYCNQWSGWYRSGLFIGHNIASSNLANAHTINCSGCQVLTGTIVQYGTGVDTITSNVTYRQAVGNTGPNSSQSGTVSGISVVNSISPNIAFN